MDYRRSEGQNYMPAFGSVECVSRPGEGSSVPAGSRLRVFLLGGNAEDHFQNILAANIAHWGYEAVIWPPDASRYGSLRQEMTGDILLYDMDAPGQPGTISGERLAEDISGARDRSGMLGAASPRARLLIVLSSRSVSRRTLEHMGGITLVRKPVDMRHLERYLRVFQHLLAAESALRGQPASQRTELRVLAAHAPESRLRKRILIADDCPEATQAIRQCLLGQSQQRCHYDVREVNDGLDLVEQCISWQPDCVVTDLLLPWLNGYQAIQCLAACPALPAPVFIIGSALTRRELTANRSYLQDNAVLYIDKPFEGEHLLALVEQALAR